MGMKETNKATLPLMHLALKPMQLQLIEPNKHIHTQLRVSSELSLTSTIRHVQGDIAPSVNSIRSSIEPMKLRNSR